MVKIKYANYTQISPERDVTSNGFSKGQINMKWNMDSMSRWNPYKSYIRMRVRLSKNGGNILDTGDGIAPNMFMGDSFWQQMNIQCNGVKVSEIDDYVQQVSSLRQRYSLPESRMKEFLSGTNFAQASITDRINQVSVDGEDQENFKENKFKPSTDQASTVQLTGETTASAALINVLGIRADATQAAANAQQDHGQATSNINIFGGGQALPVGSSFRLGLIDYTVQVVVDAQNAFVVPSSPSDVAQAAITLINSETTRRNLVGVNTNFTTSLNVGDELEIDGKRGYFVDTITDDNNVILKDLPSLAAIAATADWRTIRKDESRRIREFEIIFKPCMGLFSIDEYLAGDWKLELTPHTNSKYQRYTIESRVDKTPDTDYELEVLDLQLYLWKGRTSKVHKGSENFDFTEIRCQAQTITTNSLINKSYVVNKNSHTFSIAFQKPDAGDNTAFSKTKFRMLDDFEKRIQRYQLRINGETLPTPLPSIDTDPANNVDYAAQQYYEMLQYNGTFYLDEPEGLKTWFERGPYYSYRLPRKLNANSNRLYVSTQFAINRPENYLLLVFDHFYSGFCYTLQNGLVSSVKSNKIKN